MARLHVMSPRRLLYSWLFALALLFGQTAAFAHALTHLQGHEEHVPDKVCEVCVAQAQLGAALPPISWLPVPVAAIRVVADDPARAIACRPRLGAQARAPPRSV